MSFYQPVFFCLRQDRGGLRTPAILTGRRSLPRSPPVGRISYTRSLFHHDQKIGSFPVPGFRPKEGKFDLRP